MASDGRTTNEHLALTLFEHDPFPSPRPEHHSYPHVLHYVQVIMMLKRQLGEKMKALETFKSKYGVQVGSGGDDEPAEKKDGGAASKSSGVLVS